MSRSRVSAFLAAFAVMLSAILGTTLTSTAASAHPGGHGNYPPPPPSLVCSRGVVKKGDNVQATGRTFRERERVSIVIRLKPKGSNRYRTLRTYTVYADRQGNFYFNVRTTGEGYLVITATGQTSRKSASASLSVVDRRESGRAVAMRPAGFTGPDASVAAPKAAAPAGDLDGLTIAGLAVMAMAGGALVTRGAVRRRRKAAHTAA